MKASWHSDSEPKPGNSEVLGHPAAETGSGGSLWHRLWTTPLTDLLRGRMSCRLDVRAIVGASGLPEAVCDQVLDTVKRTRLSRCERSGIAGELIAHFADGLEGGVSPDEMLSGFGDVRTAAKLMRRAKLRCRAWPRRAMRRTGQALGVLVLVYAAATVYYATGRPKVSVDYLAQMNAGALTLPEQERAWPVYREALLALDRERFSELQNNKWLEPGDAGWEEAVRFLEDNRAALATARRAAAMEHLGIVLGTEIPEEDRELWPGHEAQLDGADLFDPLSAGSPETLLVAIQLPHVMSLQRLQRPFVIDAAQAVEQADGARVTADIEALLGMARQLRAGHMVIEQLVAGLALHVGLAGEDEDLHGLSVVRGPGGYGGRQ